MAKHIPFPFRQFNNPELELWARRAHRFNIVMKAKLPGFVDSLDKVDEKYRELYVEDTDADGKKRFKIDVEGFEDVTGLKSTVSALRTDLKKAKDRAAPLAELEEDEDPEEILAAGREVIAARKSGKQTPEVESVKNQLTTQHSKIVKGLQATIDGQAETLREVLIAQETRALLGTKELKGNPALLLPVVEKRAKIVEYDEGGKKKFRAAVIGDDGHERLDAKGKPFGIKGLLAELRENDEYSDAFEGSGASGSGASTDGGSGTRTPPAPKDTAPADERKTAKRRTGDYSTI